MVEVILVRFALLRPADVEARAASVVNEPTMAQEKTVLRVVSSRPKTLDTSTLDEIPSEQANVCLQLIIK